jgi:hypothetical protein
MLLTRTCEADQGICLAYPNNKAFNSKLIILRNHNLNPPPKIIKNLVGPDEQA